MVIGWLVPARVGNMAPLYLPYCDLRTVLIIITIVTTVAVILIALCMILPRRNIQYFVDQTKMTGNLNDFITYLNQINGCKST
jgi:hypothetical protein